jgi:hypothetical protein
MLSDYSIQGAAIVNKSCLENETLEIPYQSPKFLKFSGGGALDCVRGWRITHADHSTLAAMYQLSYEVKSVRVGVQIST